MKRTEKSYDNANHKELLKYNFPNAIRHGEAWCREWEKTRVWLLQILKEKAK